MNKLKLLIKDYWNDKQPNVWYGQNYEEIEKKKYNTYYPYIPKEAEFDKHKGEKVLEVGVGMGIDLKQYAQNGAICTGIDLTEGAIKKTRELFNHYNLKADLRVMDAEDLKFSDNTFDLVYSAGVLHHTPDTQKAIDEIYRVLKPNSKTIILLYSKSWQHYIIRIFGVGVLGMELTRMSMQELINKYSEAYGFSPLTKLYHKKEIKNMFNKFKDVKIKHYYYKNNFFQCKSGYFMGNWIINTIK